MSRNVIPPGMQHDVMSSRPPMQRAPWGIRAGVNVPSRSPGTSRGTGLALECTVVGELPLRALSIPRPAGSPFW